MQADKVLHFCAGAILMAVGFILGFLGGAGPVFTAIIGSTFTVFGAWLKEAYDAAGFGTPDTRDFWATVYGGVVAAILIVLLS